MLCINLKKLIQDHGGGRWNHKKKVNYATHPSHLTDSKLFYAENNMDSVFSVFVILFCCIQGELLKFIEK